MGNHFAHSSSINFNACSTFKYARNFTEAVKQHKKLNKKYPNVKQIL